MIFSQLRARIAGLRYEHRAIFRGVLAVGIFLITSKLVALMKEMAVAWRFGVSDVVDAYLFTFNLLQFPVSVWASIIGVVLVPYVAHLRSVNEGQLVRLRSELLGATLLLAGALGLLSAIALPWLLDRRWIGLSSVQAAFATDMIYPLLWTLPTGMLTGLWSAWIIASNRHFNTLLEGVPALVMLVTLIGLGSSAALVWGTTAGFVFQAILLAVSLLLYKELSLPVFQFKSPYWSQFLSGLGLMVASQLLINGMSLIDQLVTARLGSGALSTLGYANRLLMLVLALGATTTGRAILPVLSNLASDSRSLQQIAVRWALLLFGLGVIALLVGLLLAPFLVQTLFERGSFTQADTLRVTVMLRLSLSQVPFYFSSTVLIYTLISQRDYLSVLLITAAGVTVKLGLMAFLVPFFGLGGVALSTTGVYVLSTLMSVGILYYKARSGSKSA